MVEADLEIVVVAQDIVEALLITVVKGGRFLLSLMPIIKRTDQVLVRWNPPPGVFVVISLL